MTPLDTLLAADGTAYFSDEAIQGALADANYRSRRTVALISPKDFLALAEPGRSEDKEAGVRELIATGTRFSSLPLITFDNNGDGTGTVTGHEGRHRSRALIARGVTLMPVVLNSAEQGRGPAIRWGMGPETHPFRKDPQPIFPSVLISQKHGLYRRPMPVSVVYPEASAEYAQSPAHESLIDTRTAAGPRTVVVGDVHGQTAELREMLTEKLVPPFSQQDRLILVGDLLSKDALTRGDLLGEITTIQWLRSLREAGYDVVFVKGNHELRAEQWWAGCAPEGGPDDEKHKDEMRVISSYLSVEDKAFIQSSVFYYRIPEWDVIIVHGGIPPKLASLPEDPHAVASLSDKERKRIYQLLETRFIDKTTGKVLPKGGEKGNPNAIFWAETYDGRLGHAFFGHTQWKKLATPKEFPHATGLDLGAAGGNYLAAIVIEGGKQPYYVTVKSHQGRHVHEHLRAEALRVYQNKNTLAAPTVPPSYTLPEGFQSRGEYHLTVLDAADGKVLKTIHGWSNRVLETWLAEQVATGIEIPGTPTRLGVGYATQGDTAAYYEVYEWPEAQAWRASLGLGHKDLHVTIGFRGADPHGVSKGRETLIEALRVSGDPTCRDPFLYSLDAGVHEGDEDRDVDIGAARDALWNMAKIETGPVRPGEGMYGAFGCGHFACAFPLPRYPGYVIKITGDPSEAAAWQTVIKKAKREKAWPAGIAHTPLVFAFPKGTDGLPSSQLFGVVQEKLAPLPYAPATDGILWEIRKTISERAGDPEYTPERLRQTVLYYGASGWPKEFSRRVRNSAEEKAKAEKSIVENLPVFANAMAWLHSHGILTYDLKGDNVMSGPNGEWRIIDLGVNCAPAVKIPELREIDFETALIGVRSEALRVSGDLDCTDPYEYSYQTGEHEERDDRFDNMDLALQLLSEQVIRLGPVLGCGFYACAYPLLDYPGYVLKISGDPSDAAAWGNVIQKAKREKVWPAGIAHTPLVFAFPSSTARRPYFPVPPETNPSGSWGGLEVEAGETEFLRSQAPSVQLPAPEGQFFGIVQEELSSLPEADSTFLTTFGLRLRTRGDLSDAVAFGKEEASRDDAYLLTHEPEHFGVAKRFDTFTHALRWLDKRGILTRDIKGDNVMAGPDGEWRITDLGINCAPSVYVPDIEDLDLHALLGALPKRKSPLSEARRKFTEKHPGDAFEPLSLFGMACIVGDILMPDPIPGLPGPITAAVLAMDRLPESRRQGYDTTSGQRSRSGYTENMPTQAEERAARAEARRRKGGSSQVIRLTDQDASDAFDDAFWAAATPSERFIAGMEMIQAYLALKEQGRGTTKGLRGSRLRIIHRGG